MNGLLAWIGMAVMAGGLVAVIVSLVRKPMNSLLTANSWLAPSARFYVRAFVLVIVLAAVAAVVKGPALRATIGYVHGLGLVGCGSPRLHLLDQHGGSDGLCPAPHDPLRRSGAIP